MYDKLNMVYLEIPKLKKTKEELSSHLEWWIYVFQNLHQLQDIPKEIQSDIIKKTFDKAEFVSLPKNEQENYHKNLKVYRDLLNSHEFAYKEGKEEGIEEGEYKKAIEIASLSITQGLNNQTIALITGLSMEEIENLREP